MQLLEITWVFSFESRCSLKHFCSTVLPGDNDLPLKTVSEDHMGSLHFDPYLAVGSRSFFLPPADEASEEA